MIYCSQIKNIVARGYMKNVSINLKNCYGISELNHEFNFEKSKANIIYAPNGVMKTSLAKTFLRLSSGEEPEEKLFGRKPEYSIKIDGVDIQKEQILVIRPFEPEFESKNISTLLVNSEKKEKYESAYKDILGAKQKIIKKLNKLSKIKENDIEKQLTSDLGATNIFESIKILQTSENKHRDLTEIKYAEIFDDKVLSLLSGHEVQSGIAEYTERYNALIEQSPLYSRGKFSPTNADTVSKTLRKERFFEASHKLLLNGSQELLSKPEEFDTTLEQANSEIFRDANLKAIHAKILGGVAAVKTFQSILEQFPNISALLSDIDELRLNFWKAYYSSAQDELDNLVALYESKKQELTSIELEAQLEETLWHEAKETFKARFHVPFNIDVENHTNAILGTTAPNMVFTFPVDGGKDLRFNRGQLNSLDILSVGERRAMYLLYVIFEFRARLKNGVPTLVIIDDIADSFDYKNKYAIIEYLRELSQEPLLRLVVLTHNFDFYRTFQGRILDAAKWENSHVAQKSGGKTLILKGGKKDVSNPFELWRKGYRENAAMLVSMIPFVRNLIEYKDGQTSAHYLVLTSMIHIKEDSKDLTINNLVTIFCEVIKDATLGNTFDGTKNIVEFIYETADSLCLMAKDDEVSLENKITLSIAARLKAEEFMLAHVINKSQIKNTQTGKLFDRLREEDKHQKFSEELKTLSQVILMTPENIHLNSFMYEPLMDMSVIHLIDLYTKLKLLIPATSN